MATRRVINIICSLFKAVQWLGIGSVSNFIHARGAGLLYSPNFFSARCGVLAPPPHGSAGKSRPFSHLLTLFHESQGETRRRHERTKLIKFRGRLCGGAQSHSVHEREVGGSFYFCTSSRNVRNAHACFGILNPSLISVLVFVSA